MELELGLSLRPVHIPKQNLDLNISNSLEGSDQSCPNFSCDFKKRSFSKSFEFDDEYSCISKTHSSSSSSSSSSSMLVWDGNDEKNGKRPNSEKPSEEEEAEEGEKVNGIVGWPPIKSWRKKLIQNPHWIMNNNDNQIMGCGRRRMIINNERSRNNNNCKKDNNNSSMYVKVKMKGVGIGRKIDLMLFNSYKSLITTLLNMFSTYDREIHDKDKDEGWCNSYILSYLDKEGDWLLAGDVPWQIFIGTVQRIEIAKRSSNL